nr:glycosyltransferase family 39 protein [Chthonobacter rhizosphaerae]
MWSVPFDVHPALHYTIVKAFMVFGDGEAAVRLPSVVASLAAMGVAYAIARRLIGPVGALVTAAVLALEYTSLVYAANARNYTVLLVLMLGAFGALLAVADAIRAPARPTARRLAAPALVYAGCAVAALYTHNQSVFYLVFANAAVGVAELVRSPRTIVRLGVALILLNLPVVAAWIPWLRVILSTTDDFNWLPQAGIREAAWVALVTVLPNDVGALGALAAALAIVLGLAVTVFSRNIGLATAVLFHLIVFPLLIWAFGFVYKPIYMERTILPMLFGAALAVGAVAALVRWRAVAAAVAGAALLASAVSSVAYLTRDPADPSLGGHLVQNWRAAVAESPDTPRSAILLCESFSVPTVSTYVREADVLVLFPDGGVWQFTLDDWLAVFGLPVAERRPDVDATIARVLAERGRSRLSLSDLPARYDRITTIRPEIFCKGGFANAVRAAFAAAGLQTDGRRTYAGVTAETYAPPAR